LEDAVLPVVRQKPAGHAVHAAAVVDELKVPRGQGVAPVAPVVAPTGQKLPVPQFVHWLCAVSAVEALKVPAAHGTGAGETRPPGQKEPATHGVVHAADVPPPPCEPAAQGIGNVAPAAPLLHV
jgi:hypothetical protein